VFPERCSGVTDAAEVEGIEDVVAIKSPYFARTGALDSVTFIGIFAVF
jgi:hypothetical protein